MNIKTKLELQELLLNCDRITLMNMITYLFPTLTNIELREIIMEKSYKFDEIPQNWLI